MIRLDLEVIKRKALNFVVLEIGSNDICDSHCDADKVALSIVAFTELLIKSLSVSFVCAFAPTVAFVHVSTTPSSVWVQVLMRFYIFRKVNLLLLRFYNVLHFFIMFSAG